MTDNTELKRLATAAPEGPWFGPEYAPGTSYVFDADLGTLLHYESIDTEQDACLRYVAAANPAAVLGLIADNERLSRSVESLIQMERATGNRAIEYAGKCDQLRAEVAGLRTGYEAYEQVNAELKAEVEGLRKALTSSREFLMRDAKVRRMTDGARHISPMFPLRKLVMEQIDAALGQGEQS